MGCTSTKKRIVQTLEPNLVLPKNVVTHSRLMGWSGPAAPPVLEPPHAAPAVLEPPPAAPAVVVAAPAVVESGTGPSGIALDMASGVVGSRPLLQQV